MVFRTGFALVLVAAAAVAAPAYAQDADAARTARLRILCVQISGGDLTDPVGLAAFRRCLQQPPIQAMKENIAPPQGTVQGTIPPLVQSNVQLVKPTTGPLVGPARPGDGCAAGFVWREAIAGDHVCVPPDTRRQAQADNVQARVRVAQANSDGCSSGYVWREATPADHVCVTPPVRAQAWADNAAAASRVAP